MSRNLGVFGQCKELLVDKCFFFLLLGFPKVTVCSLSVGRDNQKISKSLCNPFLASS